jgi:two-component system chemotaxis response regulator CheB
MQLNRPVRLLVVEDSAVVRSVLKRGFERSGIEVVGTAIDPYQARDMIVELNPDVITLDMEMPRMDGLTFLERLMAHKPMPVVVLSSLTPAGSEIALRALELGAVAVLEKPTSDVGEGLRELVMERLADQVKEAACARPRPRSAPRPTVNVAAKAQAIERTSDKIVAIGASTGGTEALSDVLTALPVEMPGIVVVQHMPPVFTKSFAERLDGSCALRVKEAEEGDQVKDGLVLIAPGNFHMTLRRSGAHYYVELRQGPPVQHMRPSVDVLMLSVAREAAANSVGVILTGMGKDGAEGLLAMRQAGAHTSVVYGMPGEAMRVGAVETELPLEGIPKVLVQRVRGLETVRKA